MTPKTIIPRIVAVTGVVALSSVSFTAVAHASPAIRAVPYSIRLEDQFLAHLGYLPVTFYPSARRTSTPTTTTTTTTTTLPPTTTTTTTLPPTSTTTSTTTTTTLPPTPTTTTTLPPKKSISRANPTELVRGTFRWRFSALPSALREKWTVGTDNVILTGALMQFQLVHNLVTTGTINGTTWRTLVQAVLRKERDPMTYNTVFVSQAQPERLRLYTNNRLAFTTLVNTGISASPTENGTFPVYLRYLTTTMSGVEPNGTPYHDTGIPWVSYFNGGDALHGFIRASYGFPQSLGCVEMPFADAHALWPHTPIGTLVTIV